MQKFLIIQTAFIGDVILATPVAEKLRRSFPEAQIDFLLRKGNETLLENHKAVDNVLIWDKKNGKYKDLYRLIKKIRKQNYDVVFNLQRFITTGTLTLLSNSKKTIGFDQNPVSRFFSESKRYEVSGKGEQEIHEVDRNLLLIEDLCDSTFERPTLYPSEADYEKVKGPAKYVCIAPTSVWFTKQFPASKWVELINSINSDLAVYLLGGPADRKACSDIVNAINRDNVENLAGRLSFLESAALMQGAKMNYVNDSAPMHMASAMNAPTTAVFCSTIPEFGYYPLSEDSKVVETNEELNCRPCGIHGYKNCPEGHFKCSEIPIGQIV